MPARLLLIEDDASIARFVELALQELPEHDPAAPAVALVHVRSVAEARAALAEGGWRLVISDLMLPDGSAEVLLDEGLALAAQAPTWVVFSAGVPEDRRRALTERGVARTLRKPVSLLELMDTVSTLLRNPATAPPEPAPAAVPAVAGPDPVQAHFGGDRELYETFRAGCLVRFADDLAEGEAATAARDVAALRRVAHGLKAVLALIGQPGLAAQAAALEDAAAAWTADRPWPAGWATLARGVQDLRG